MTGVQRLVEHGFLPIITAARVWPLEQDGAVVAGFVQCCARPAIRGPG